MKKSEYRTNRYQRGATTAQHQSHKTSDQVIRVVALPESLDQQLVDRVQSQGCNPNEIILKALTAELTQPIEP